MNYQKIYNRICERAKLECEDSLYKKVNKIEYYEGHHIIPKCLGGKGRSDNWNHSNITPLTAKEHFVCHHLLIFIHANTKNEFFMIHAFWAMCNQKKSYQKRYTPSPNTYSNARILYINSRSYVPRSKEIKEKISNSLKGKASYNKGKKQSIIKCPHCNIDGGEYTMKRWHFNNCIYNLQNKKLNRCTGARGSNKKIQNIIECIYCKKLGAQGNMKRYHFDNCKHKM